MALSKEERKMQKEIKRRGKIIYKHRKYSYTNWLLRLEYSLFGWIYAGNEIDEIDDGYSGTVSDSGHVSIRHNSHIVKYAYFCRPAAYPNNILFTLTAFFSRIFSAIRVWMISLLPLAAAAVGLSFLAGQDTGVEVLKWVGIAYGIIVGGSIALALLGFLWRKVFRLDQKCDELMEEAGYVAWGDNKEDYKDQF